MAPQSLDQFVNDRVVLDTAGPIIYIGQLVSHGPEGYWLMDADMHDRNEGHSTKEQYIDEACRLEREGTRRTTRRKVFVERSAVISVSAVHDIVCEDRTIGEDSGDAALGGG
jgi:hypothetical protein